MDDYTAMLVITMLLSVAVIAQAIILGQHIRKDHK